MTTTAKILGTHHRFPEPGAYIAHGGTLYRVVSTESRVHQHADGSGRANYVWGVVEEADWSDCPEGEEFPAELELVDDA